MKTENEHIREQNVDARNERIDADAPPKVIEKQIDAKRADINRTLSELEDRFSPGRMVDQALGMARDNSGELAQNLGRQIRDNPMPFLLTGIGLIWAMTSSQGGGSSAARYRSRYGYDGDYRGDRGRDFDDDFDDGYDAERERHYRAGGGSDLQPRYTGGSVPSSTGSYATSGYSGLSEDDGDDKGLADKAREKLDAMGDRLSDAGESISDKASEIGERAGRRRDRLRHDASRGMASMRARGREYGYRGRRGARSMADSVSDLVQEQPMLAGALGVAVGAIIGALLPASDLEDRYLGEPADEAKRVAREQAEAGVEQARDGAEEAAVAAREKVEEVAAKARQKSEEALEKADEQARETDEKARETESSV